jgi:hypothetical protein
LSLITYHLFDFNEMDAAMVAKLFELLTAFVLEPNHAVSESGHADLTTLVAPEEAGRQLNLSFQSVLKFCVTHN